MNLPDGWREQAPGKWFDAAGDARGVIHRNGTPHFAMVEAPDRDTKAEAERDLERMVWAIEGEDDRRALVEMMKEFHASDGHEPFADLYLILKAARSAVGPSGNLRDIEALTTALRSDRDKAQRQAHLTEQALTAARAEIADLRAAAERRDARERARHPVVRRITHALYVLRGVE